MRKRNIASETLNVVVEVRWLAAALVAAVVLFPGLLPSADVALAAGSDAVVVGKAPAATRGFPSVVILQSGVAEGVDVPADPVTLDQIGMTFVPGVLVARVGQVVELRNSEDVLHNVNLFHVERDRTVVNVATPPGIVQKFTPDEPGTYIVLCNVHPEMEGYIFVTTSPYVVVAEEDGSFELQNVPPGSYTMRVWNVDEDKQWEEAVSVQGARTELDVRESG